MDPMLESFINESRDNLETAGSCFLTLENNPADTESMNDLFRAMHTIKGSSGLFDLPAFTQVVHAAEDVLDTAREGELELTPESIDLFLDTMDQVAVWLDNLESTGSLGQGAEAIGQAFVEKLRSLLNDGSSNSDLNSQTEDKETAPTSEPDVILLDEIPGWILNIPEEFRLQATRQAIKERSNLLAVEYTPAPECFFAGDDPLHTVRKMPGVHYFTIESASPWPAPLELDPYQCNVKFNALSAASENDVHHFFRYVSDQVTINAIPFECVVLPEGETCEIDELDSFLTASRQALSQNDYQSVRKQARMLLDINAPDCHASSVLRWLDVTLEPESPDKTLINALLDSLVTGHFELSPTEDIASLEEEQQPQEVNLDSDTKNRVIEILEVQKTVLGMPCSDVSLTGRVLSVVRIVDNLLKATGGDAAQWQELKSKVQKSNDVELLITFITQFITNFTSDDGALSSDKNIDAEQNKKEKTTTNKSKTPDTSTHKKDKSPDSAAKLPSAQNISSITSSSNTVNKTLKVDQHRIDSLMDLVGELVVAKNALPFLAKRADNDFGVAPLAKEIKAQYAVINRLAEELQGAMMQIRMVPMSNVFQRFPRLVRDLSRKLNKNIRLVLEGEDTEADKNVVESLADPLIHLVRNSLDHGLETSDERVANGKPEQGTIILRATPRDDQVVIEIVDDGRGIDPEVIKHKAYEKGVIDEQRLDTISDHDALQLIFAAGFSTAEQVSDLSGRGVGMDVVRTVVRQAGGSVVVESKKGHGATVRLSLPLSISISRVMMVEVDAQTYGISMDDIIETVRLPVSEIQRIKHRQAIVLRDRLIPLFNLREILHLSAQEQNLEEIAVLVMQVDGQEIGLIIDEFHEGLDIIQKPLEGVMAQFDWYSGAALLGDGRVLLVLNIQELLSCQ